MKEIQDTFTIIRRELKKGLGNKRSIITTIIMPGVVMGLLYYVIGIITKRANGLSDVAMDKAELSNIMSAILPMVLMGLLFSACLSIVSESFAGEKEKGTLSLLVLAPIKSSALCTGKIIGLCIIAFMGGMSSYLGVMCSLPTMFNMNIIDCMSMYSVKEHVLLLATIFSTVLLLISFMSIASMYANSAKEANTTMAPFVSVAMIIGIISLMDISADASPFYMMIPFYNCVLVFKDTLAFSENIARSLLVYAVNIVYCIGSITILSKMLKNEKRLCV